MAGGAREASRWPSGPLRGRKRFIGLRLRHHTTGPSQMARTFAGVAQQADSTPRLRSQPGGGSVCKTCRAQRKSSVASPRRQPGEGGMCKTRKAQRKSSGGCVRVCVCVLLAGRSASHPSGVSGYACVYYLQGAAQVIRRVQTRQQVQTWQKGANLAEGCKRCKKWVSPLHPCTFCTLLPDRRNAHHRASRTIRRQSRSIASRRSGLA
jgi:hypothetical protein